MGRNAWHIHIFCHVRMIFFASATLCCQCHCHHHRQVPARTMQCTHISTFTYIMCVKSLNIFISFLYLCSNFSKRNETKRNWGCVSNATKMHTSRYPILVKQSSIINQKQWKCAGWRLFVAAFFCIFVAVFFTMENMISGRFAFFICCRWPTDIVVVVVVAANARRFASWVRDRHDVAQSCYNNVHDGGIHFGSCTPPLCMFGEQHFVMSNRWNCSLFRLS